MHRICLNGLGVDEHALACCTDHLPDAARFAMPAGWIRIRTSRRNLEAAAFPDLDCEDKPEDVEEIRIQARPAPHSQPHIIER